MRISVLCVPLSSAVVRAVPCRALSLDFVPVLPFVLFSGTCGDDFSGDCPDDTTPLPTDTVCVGDGNNVCTDDQCCGLGETYRM